VVVDKPSSWRLYDTPSVGGGVVWLTFAECNTLGHLVLDGNVSEMIWAGSEGTNVLWGVLDTTLALCC
jgi:hypothetical protein